MCKIQRAVLSVSDKRGIIALGEELVSYGIEIIGTGGTAQTLEMAGIPITPIRQITGNTNDSYFSGRMKTISFNFESALLFDRNNVQHWEQADELGIRPINLVVGNLYPFEQVIENPETSMEQAIDNIDVGGPCMIRAGAKNWKSVAVVTDPGQYPDLIKELKAGNGTLSDSFRLKLALKAFKRTAKYDRAISGYLENYLDSTKDNH